MREQQTLEWQQYQRGIDYNHKIDLYSTVDKNEAFYAGDQWRGVQAKGLPTPVFNFFKRIINYFIASILSQNIKINFIPQSVGDDPANEDEQFIKDAAELVSQYSDTLWEKLKMHQKLRQCLLDAALTGDACVYSFWNPDIETGQAMKGEIDLEVIDNVNVFFGNPNDWRVSTQPYILIVYRDLVSKLREEAKKNGVKSLDLITPDTDNAYQAGDMSKIELDDKDEVSGKTIAILKLWKEKGKVYAKKSTKFVDIREKWDTKLKDYPVAFMNWDRRKNCYHGQAVGTGLVPNQIFINKMFAMVMLNMMHSAFPKAVYNKTFLKGWNNAIGSAIGIDAGNLPLNQVATYLAPGQMNGQVLEVIDLAIKYTKDTLGATDAALGNVKPDNTSAIIAVQQASAIPLENIKQNLYQFIEDIGNIWLDFMANYYGKRSIDVEVLGKRQIEEFDFERLKKMQFRIKIDVGPSSYWSEITAVQTLDNLLNSDRINFMQYLDRLPSGLIPKRQELIEDIKSNDTKQQFIFEQMARFLETQPPEVQQEIMNLPPDQQEQRLMKMMMQPQEPIEQPIPTPL